MVCSYAHFDSSYLGLCLEIYFLSGSNELNSLNLSSPILCSRTWLLVFDHWLYQGKISTPTSANPFQDILGAVCVAPSTVLRLARCRIYSILIISKHYHQGKWYSFLVSLSTTNCLCASTVGRRNTRLWIMPHKQCDLIVKLLPLQIPVYFR